MQKITIPHDLPIELHSLANAAIDMANGLSRELDLEPLHEWLLWESNNHEQLEVYIFPDEFDLSDSALQADLENKNIVIDDDMRVAYARKQITHAFENEARYDFLCCCAYKLQRENKENTYVCAITHNLGQGGLEADWEGFFPTAIDFWDHLENLGGCRKEGDQIIFKREAILENWSRGLPPRLVFSRTEKNAE